MFVLCYVCYASIHIYREFWSISKASIEGNTDKYHVDKSALSKADTTNFIVYGLSQFFNGPLADEYNQRIVLPISFGC
jgi:sugar phosphate permease